jgi:signal transduction histidine kinase
MGLDPESRVPLDLVVELTELADAFERSTLIDVSISADPSVAAPLDPEETVQLIQLTREAMSNVARHAEATSLRLDLAALHDVLRLSIIDDGRGFDTDASRRPGHHGLTNMHARAEALGGSLAIVSGPGGTSVVFEMPRADARNNESST